MRAVIPVLLAAAVLAGCGRETPPTTTGGPEPQPAAPTAGDADGARRIEADVRFLADDLLEGREAGTRGYDLAAHYVATQFRAIGLEPAGDAVSGAGDAALSAATPAAGWYQTVPFVQGRRKAEGARFEIVAGGKRTALAFQADFLHVVHFTGGTFEVTAPAVFVGQAVHAPELGHDDFAGVDVRGKIAVLFPNAPSKFPNDQRAYYASGANKARELEARGAVGYVYLGDPKEEAKRPWEVGAANWQRVAMRLVAPDGAIVDDFPGLRARATLRAGQAAALFEGAPHTADEVFAMLEAGQLASFDLATTLTLAGAAELQRVESRNVVARLPGSDPTLANEHVAFTAHLDHVGVGAAVEGDTVYNGAVDNALGVAILLEAARELVAAERPRRSIVFVALTAEEKGLLGAEWYARHPTVAGPLIANVNMDMPILLQPQEDVVPTGVEHSTLESVLARAAAEIGVKISPDPMPEEVVFIRSDQYAFIKQGVPAVFLNGGVIAGPGASDPGKSLREFLAHRYHLPSDDVDQTIHYPTAARLARLNQRIGTLVANDAARPTWKPGDFFGEKFAGKR